MSPDVRCPSRAAATLAVVAAAVGWLLAGTAGGAEGCPVTMQVRGSVVAVELDPSAVTVQRGSCLAIANTLAVPVDVHVAPDFDRQVPPDGQVQYPARVVGSHAVTVATLVSQDRGSVTVRAAAQPTTSGGSATSRPPATSSPSPPAGTRSPAPDRSEPGPLVTPVVSPPPSAPVRTPSTGPVPTPTLAPTSPGAAPSASPTPAVAGSLEPPTDRSAGLPAALAALAIVGSGAGLLRVLLAEPVDGAPAVGGSA